VEDCRQLDASRWMREGILKAGIWQSGRWIWYRDGERKEETASIGYEVNTRAVPPWVRLTYRFTESGLEADYRVALETTQPRFGGLRWWFRCPLVVRGQPCGRRVGKLYLPSGGRYYGCRHCYDLTYTSCQESRKYTSLYRQLARETRRDVDTVRRLLKRVGRRGLE
jgi:hypothetical protein